jgi:hypothetical protein
MASLKQIVSTYRDEIIDGIAWVAIFKRGRSWSAEAYWPEDGSYEDGYVFDGFEIQLMEEIAQIDHKAICINGYYMGFGEDFTLEDIENKVRYFYEERRNQLSGDFLECMVVRPA